ncbi:uncharacterized protein RAG0_05633 [Rhynchosporium agropyri]|uniref:Uncharacterized protein n=1 Tax=Rhynchosporium agropyri TaxID=914238 RepID=A0A1E1KE28_9HELO|nr:uncharacterized protein RAG0_05633 [Rhynchosporium agropyri]
MAVPNAIMIGITGIMTFPLPQRLLPSTDVHDYHCYRGHCPNIALFGANGFRIGFKSGERNGKLKSGKPSTIAVKPYDDGNNKTPE